MDIGQTAKRGNHSQSNVEASDKQVILLFLPSESGVDGAHSLYESPNNNPAIAWFEASVRGLIKRSQFAIPPLALMILASTALPGVQQYICDLRFEPFPYDKTWDLVGIGVHTGMARKAFALADELRTRGLRVALGGPHVTLFPETCRPHADILVLGEADEIWKELLYDLKAGTLKGEYRPETLPDLTHATSVNKAALDKRRYFTTNLIQTGRGCQYRCDFCNVHLINGRKLRKRRVDDVVDEAIRFHKEDRRIFFFVDDSINADPAYALELFRKLIPLQIRWFGQATTNLGDQPELLETFARSGCQALLVGIESIEPASRTLHNKQQNRSAELLRAITAIRRAGISLYGSFIYGLDGDTLETPAIIRDFVSASGLDVPGINILRPTPGTLLFERLRSEGRLLFNPLDPAAYRYTFGQEMLYRPKNITLPDFIDSYSKLTRELFSIGNSLKRGMAAPRAKTAVTLFNLFYTHLYALSRNDLQQQKNKYCI